MKFYDYSVKDTLTSYFGEDAIFEMRKKHSGIFEPEDEKNILPLLWREADEKALNCFLKTNFLLNTVLEDDYIAYLYQSECEKKAYLMFMVTEDEPIFSMDSKYVRELIDEWKEKGYEASILRECLNVEYYGTDKSRGFHFTSHIVDGKGSAIYDLKCVNGKDILAFASHRCLDYYNRKMVFISGSEDLMEYECLFTRSVI